MSAKASGDVIYYNQHGLVVTGRVVVADNVRYDLDQLSAAAHATGGRHPGVRACAMVGAANTIVLGAIAATTGSTAVLLVGASVLLLSWLVGLFYARRWPRQHMLVADYRGQQVTLLRTHDQEHFGRVARALRRAMERAL